MFSQKLKCNKTMKIHNSFFQLFTFFFCIIVVIVIVAVVDLCNLRVARAIFHFFNLIKKAALTKQVKNHKMLQAYRRADTL